MKFFLQKQFWRSLPRRLAEHWHHWQRRTFFIMFLLTLAWGGWLWNYDFSVYRWTDEQKNDYKNSKLRVTQFKQDDFQKTLDMLDQRRIDYEMETGGNKEIFGVDKIAP